MINLGECIKKYKSNGYDEIYATAKVSQDMVLQAIEKSKYRNNIAIKGGLVMFNLTKNIRRATIDIDIDLIHLSLGIPNIIKIFKNISDEEIRFIVIENEIEELKHEDYKGKRVNVEIIDNFNNKILTKIDIGVHTEFDILLDEIVFDINVSKKNPSLLVNSKEQIFVEKIIPFLKHGSATTRYKDLFDIYWLIENNKLDKDKIIFIFERKIFNKSLNNICNYESLIYYLKRTLASKRLKNALDRSVNNWLDIESDNLIDSILKYSEEFSSVAI